MSDKDTNSYLVDGLGNPVGHRPGFVYQTDADESNRRQQLYDEVRAALSTRWKGGFEVGDQVTVGDRQLTVIGQLELRDKGGRSIGHHAAALRM